MLTHLTSPRHAVIMAAMTVMLLLVVSTARGTSTMTDAIPRCDDDGATRDVSVGETYTGVLMYQGLSFCESGSEALIVVVKDPEPPHAVVPLNDWTYTVGINGPTPATLTLNAMCGDQVVCQSSITCRVKHTEESPSPQPSASPDSSKTTEPVYPMCSKASKVRTYPVGEVSSDTFPIDIKDVTCAYTTSVSVGPSVGTVTPSVTGLSYTFTAPSTAKVDDRTSVGYTVQCNGKVVCADTVTVVFSPASTTTVPPTSSLAPTTAPPVPLPMCSKDTKVNTYVVGNMYKGELPLDLPMNGCVYTATIKDPSAGVAVIENSSNPLQYLYATERNALPQDTEIPYTIACNGVSVCQGFVLIRLTLDAPACPNTSIALLVKPGAALDGTINSGVMCSSGAAPLLSLRSPVSGLLLSEKGTFSFQAPATENDVAATVLVECDGKIMCQTEVVFVVAERTVAPPTTSTAAPVETCAKSFQYQIPISTSTMGNLNSGFITTCKLTTYRLQSSGGSAMSGHLVLNLLGEFQYTAPDTQGVDYVTVDVYCEEKILCRTQLVFTAFTPITTAPPTASPLPPCANVYYYYMTPGMKTKSSLANRPGQDLCPYGRYFTLSKGPQEGTIDLMPIGDFLYEAPAQGGPFSFTFIMHCLDRSYCAGTAYLIVSNEWTLDPTQTPSPTDPGGTANITHPQITCRGTCDAHAWRTYPSIRVWDTTLGTGYARKDGRPVNGMTVTWRNSSLVFVVDTLIGNLGVRFPSFEPITWSEKTYMEPTDFASSVAPGSTGFEMSCLAKQGRVGMGEDVWRWSSLSSASGTGRVGTYYRSGESWYHKFGGKHVGCDTFSDPCAYAPLLTPTTYTNSSLGRWTIDVDDCDATWTGTFPYSSVEKMVKHDGTPLWTFVGHHQLQGTLYSESVQASSWLEPGQFEARYDTHNILITLNQFASVTKENTESSLISVDAEFFTYVDKETRDQAFGINLLVYPFVESFMDTSYARNSHVKGFKWIAQEWMSLDTAACPTCTGAKSKCSVPFEGPEASYTGSTFPEGDCANNTGRVHLVKGPAMSPSACPYNQMHVFNQSGFSPTRNCQVTYQNVTLRGIVPGSSGLDEMLLRKLSIDGTVRLLLLMDDNTYQHINVRLSMYVSSLAKDVHRRQGGLSMCRSGSYWPVLDPLGSSLPSNPFPLGFVEATPLCVDDLSSAYGPNDWALLTVNLPGVKPKDVTVGSVYVLYNNLRIYLVYRNQSTGAVVIPEGNIDGAWWQYEYPFLAFRDLGTSLKKNSTTFSTEMQASPVAEDVVYAFAFIPGSLEADTHIEVVVEVSIHSDGAATGTTEFHRVLHIDPLLTQLSRQGPPPSSSSTKREPDRTDLYAIGASAGVAVALVVTVIFFMVADNNRPLPKWVPRGKLIKKTVLSVLPTGLRGKKKANRINHKDMYDAMNSGRY